MAQPIPSQRQFQPRHGRLTRQPTLGPAWSTLPNTTPANPAVAQRIQTRIQSSSYRRHLQTKARTEHPSVLVNNSKIPLFFLAGLLALVIDYLPAGCLVSSVRRLELASMSSFTKLRMSSRISSWIM